MAKRNNPKAKSEKKGLVIERTFDAPVALVWKSITRKEDIKKWSFDIKEFKLKVGFEFHFDAEDNGVKWIHHCKITAVIPEKKLAYTWRYEGYAGDTLVTFELFAKGNKTKLRLTHEGLETFPKIPALTKSSFVEGWTNIIGKNLKEFVESTAAKNQEFVISRVFDAPRHVVWKALKNPEHMKHWWGPKGFTVKVAKMDFREGGSYHYCMRSPDGQDMWGKFVYREIIKPEKIVFINSFSDEKGGLTRHPKNPNWPLEMLSTFTFEEKGGKTTFTIRWIPYNATEEERQTFDKGRAGMTQGWTGTLDQLDTFLKRDQHYDVADGKICYLEIPASDIDRSSSFYKEVFNWNIRKRGDGNVSFDDTLGAVSGTWVLGRKAHTEPGLIVHIMVDNAGKTIAKILANGGKIVQPIGKDAPEITARFSDPAGNVFGIYQHHR